MKRYFDYYDDEEALEANKFLDLCYALYKNNWIKKHITEEQYRQAIVKSFDLGYNSVDEYIIQYSPCDLPIFSSIEYFLKKEYKDEKVMKEIFKGTGVEEELIKDWKKYKN